MGRIIQKRFDVQIGASNETVKADFRLDKTAEKVIAVLLTSDRDDMMFYRGTIRLDINGKEVFPEGFEAKLLQTGLNVNPGDRYRIVDRLPGNGVIHFEYTDTVHSLAPFVGYRVSINLQVETSDSNE